jgi:hypothetical protein
VTEAVDDLIARTRALPERLRSLRVVTDGWSDLECASLASDRARNLQAHRLPVSDRAGPRESWHTTSWMVFDPDDWNESFVGLWPTRFREDITATRSDGTVRHHTRARDGDGYWRDDGDGASVTDARRLRASLHNSWVVGRGWTGSAHTQELVDRTRTLDRAVALLHVTPAPGKALGSGPLHAGDAHDLTIDVETGLTLAITSFVDDESYQHYEVTALEIDADVSNVLTAVPEGATAVPPSAGSRSIEEIAADTDLAVFRATWLPDDYTYQAGAAYGGEHPHVSIVYSRDRREFVQLIAEPATPITDERYDWTEVRRDGRTVAITDAGDAPGERIAHTTIDGTRIVLMSRVPAEELLRVAFSLEVVPCPD